MPQLRLGTTPVANIKLGSTQLREARLGTTLVWAATIDWIGSAATLSVTARSSTWGPALVPSGRTVHWDASHEASIHYRPDTTFVERWDDLSGNDWYLLNSIEYEQPRRVIGYNGLPVIEFEADEWLVHWIDPTTADEINLPQPITVQIVAAANPYPSYPVGLTGGSGTGAGVFQVTVQNATSLLFAAGNFINHTGTFAPDQMLITAVFNGASSIQRVNGTQIGTGNVGTSGITRLQIGITHTLVNLTVCEIVYYDRVLTGPEIAYNEDLLTAKWFKPAGVWTGSAATVTIHGAARTWFTGTAPAFEPDHIENCFGWWDASDATTFTFSSGVSVSQWRDKAGTRHLTAPSSGDEPDRTGTINALATVTFDRAAWMYINAGATGDYLPDQPTTVFVVATMAIGGDWQGLIGSSDGAVIQRRPDNNLLSITAGTETTHTLDTNPHLITAVFDRGRSQQRIDGDQVSATNTGPQNFGQFRVGTAPFAGWKLEGKVAEVCVYDRNLTSTEIDEIETYLSDKWFGPPLPQDWTGSALALTITATSGVWGTTAAPGAPTLNTATTGDTEVALAWTAGSAGSSAITDYIIEKSPNGSTSWTTVSESTSTATTYTVTGLTNGTIQYFRVSAVNAVGTGPVSNVLSATPTAPSAGFTDDFNRADTTTSTGLGAAWDNTTPPAFYIASNKATHVAGTSWTHYLTSMGGPDHYIEADIGPVYMGSSRYVIIHARRNPANHDSYVAFVSPDTGNFIIARDGSFGYADIGANGPSASVPGSAPGGSWRVRLEVEGSTLRLYSGGVLQMTRTDTTFTTGNYVGFHGYTSGGGIGENFWDNFEAGPL